MANKTGNLTSRDFSVVDLFCGIGGLSHGFVLENFKVDAGIDSDPTCRYAYETNNSAPFIHQDVSRLKASDINSLFSGRKILVGCAPCQPFSIYTHKMSVEQKKRSERTKWKLLYTFGDLIQEAHPDIVSMENVPQLMHFDNGRIFNHFVARLRKEYFVTYSVVNAQDYGVAQRRKRLVLFASKYGQVALINRTITNGCFRTVRDEIGDLPIVEAGVGDPNDPVHRARKLGELSVRRIRAMKPGGFWRDWDEELKLKCHKTKSGRGFRSVYGRMRWDDVSPTITTCCTGLNNGRFGHPEQDRALTLREAALLQSFPKDYDFVDPNRKFNSTNLARHIGNAVPVTLGRVIAKSISLHIKAFANS
jgi:DNA (cytosine-5)-methyltransferase 1